jgi:hypothetical protein
VTLVEFLLARIAEDEDRAKYETPHWADCDHFRYFSEGGLPCTCMLGNRLLAECEAKRRIIDLHGDAMARDPFDPDVCAYCNDAPHPCLTLRLLTLPYADHPDYQQEWRP